MVLKKMNRLDVLEINNLPLSSEKFSKDGRCENKSKGNFLLPPPIFSLCNFCYQTKKICVSLNLDADTVCKTH